MRMRRGRRGGLAAAVCAGAALATVLAAAAGCSGSPGTGTGVISSGPAPSARTLSPDPPRRGAPGRGLAHLRPGLRPQRRGRRRRPAGGRCAAGRLAAHLDGAVYGQPLLVGDKAIAATEND